MSASTKRKAALYRKAARHLEKGTEFKYEPVAYACHALELVGAERSLCEDLKFVFAHGCPRAAWLSPWRDGEDFEGNPTDVRILALCLMAAMVEEGAWVMSYSKEA